MYRGREAGAPARRTVERWALPSVEDLGATTGGGRLGSSSARVAEDAAALAQSRIDEATAALARAQAEAQAQRAELDERIKRFDSLLRQLAEPLRLLDEEVERELLGLALAVGSQIARRELRADPGQMIAILRQCLEQLPLNAREVRVHLHPEDAAAVRAQLAPPAARGAWDLVEDPTLSRGGCVVRSENSRIDDRFESRVHAVIAAALGDERSAVRQAHELGLGDAAGERQP